MITLCLGLLITMPLLNLMPFGVGLKTLVLVTKSKNYSDLLLILLMKFLTSLIMDLLLVTTSWLENSITDLSNYLLIPSEYNKLLKISSKS